MGLHTFEAKTYATVISDGSIRVKTEQNDPEAVARTYIDRDTKAEVTKYERKYKNLDGYISAIEFREGKFGKQLQITINDGDDDIILSLNTKSNYAEDLMKKLPNVDFANKVNLVPYSFEDDKKKTRRGITVYQSEKVGNYFADSENNPINGYPEPEGDTKGYDSDDWIDYFNKCRKFLIKHTEEAVIPMVLGKPAKEVEDSGEEKPF